MKLVHILEPKFQLYAGYADKTGSCYSISTEPIIFIEVWQDKDGSEYRPIILIGGDLESEDGPYAADNYLGITHDPAGGDLREDLDRYIQNQEISCI